jgi:hypothetical protein
VNDSNNQGVIDARIVGSTIYILKEGNEAELDKIEITPNNNSKGAAFTYSTLKMKFGINSEEIRPRNQKGLNSSLSQKFVSPARSSVERILSSVP